MNGYLVELDARQFAQKVVRLLTDEETRRGFSVRAVAKAKRLSSRAMAKKLEYEYLQLLEKPRKRANKRQWHGLYITRF